MTANIEQLCISEFPHCITYDPMAQCISTAQTVCFGDINVNGHLKFGPDGGFEANSTRYFSFKIGDTLLYWNGTTLVMSDAPVHIDTYALPLIFDPDHFARLRREGSTLVIDSPTLKLIGHLIGPIHADNIAYFHDRIYLGANGGPYSIFSRNNGRLQVLGNPLTEFLDNLTVAKNFTVKGYVNGGNLKLSETTNIDMHGAYSYIRQHTGDLEICALAGVLKLCGTQLQGNFPAGIDITGEFLNHATFLDGITVGGTSSSISGTLSVMNLIVAGSLTLSGTLNMASASLTGSLTVGTTTTTALLHVLGTGTIGTLLVTGGSSMQGPVSFYNVANFIGPLIAGNGASINGQLLTIVTDNISSNSLGAVDFNTSGFMNLHGDDGMCIGKYEMSETTDHRRYCVLSVRKAESPLTKSAAAYLNAPAIRHPIKFYDSIYNESFLVGYGTYNNSMSAYFLNQTWPRKVFVVDADIMVTGFGFFGNDIFSNFSTAQRWYWPRDTIPLISDARLKENIRSTPAVDSATRISKLKVYDYTFKADVPGIEKLPAGSHRGVIAQELRSVIPDAVHTRSDNFLGVDYQQIVPDLINTVKQLLAENQRMHEKLESYETRLTDLQSLIDSLPFSVKVVSSEKEYNRLRTRS